MHRSSLKFRCGYKRGADLFRERVQMDAPAGLEWYDLRAGVQMDAHPHPLSSAGPVICNGRFLVTQVTSSRLLVDYNPAEKALQSTVSFDSLPTYSQLIVGKCPDNCRLLDSPCSWLLVYCFSATLSRLTCQLSVNFDCRLSDNLKSAFNQFYVGCNYY